MAQAAVKSNQQSGGKQAIIDNYVTVAERVSRFYATCPQGRILTKIVEHDREAGFILMCAEVYRHPDDVSPAATGHAYEYKDAGYVQRTNYIEVSETSAVGRALAFLGFETHRGIPTEEDMKRASELEQPKAGPTLVKNPPGGAPPGKSLTIAEIEKLPGDRQNIEFDKLLDRLWEAAGNDPAALNDWVNQRFKVDRGLDSLALPFKKQLALRWQSEVAQARQAPPVDQKGHRGR